MPLINLYCSIDLSDEKECGEKANGTSDEPEGDGDDDCIDEIDQGGHEVVNVELCVEVKNAIGEHVNSGAPRDCK